MARYFEKVHANDFNSVIDYQDLTLRIYDYVLTLKLRVWLKAMNAPSGQTTFQAYDASGGSATAQSWEPAEFELFRKEFKRQCYLAWNDAFVLIPPASYNGFVDPSGVRRNVRCFLQVDYYDRGGEGIHTVEAYRIAKGGGQLRANSSLITSEDVKPGSHSTDALKPIQYKQVSGKMQISGGNPGGQTYSWQQHAIPHEVGHLLGLGHIANHANTCKKSGPNSKGCYGLFLEDAMNIMGAGDALSVKNAEPWRKRIIQHAPETKINHWGVDFASPEARLRGLWSLKSA